MRDNIQKITANIPAGLLASAQAATGKGITETICEGLEALRRRQAYLALRSMRGEGGLALSYEQLKELRD